LLAIGDSIIAGVGADTVADALPGQVAEELARLLDCEIFWSAYGFIGATSSTVRQDLLPRLPSQPFDAIVLSVGVNDVTSLRTIRQWSEDLGCLLSELRAHYPDAVIALVGIPPMATFPLLPQPLRSVMGIRAKTLDDAAKAEASKRDKVLHVPIDIEPGPVTFSADGFHPSTASYRELGQGIAEAISPMLSG